jgi:hypothetical protein
VTKTHLGPEEKLKVSVMFVENYLSTGKHNVVVNIAQLSVRVMISAVRNIRKLGVFIIGQSGTM